MQSSSSYPSDSDNSSNSSIRAPSPNNILSVEESYRLYKEAHRVLCGMEHNHVLMRDSLNDKGKMDVGTLRFMLRRLTTDQSIKELVLEIEEKTGRGSLEGALEDIRENLVRVGNSKLSTGGILAILNQNSAIIEHEIRLLEWSSTLTRPLLDNSDPDSDTELSDSEESSEESSDEDSDSDNGSNH